MTGLGPRLSLWCCVVQVPGLASQPSTQYSWQTAGSLAPVFNVSAQPGKTAQLGVAATDNLDPGYS